MAWDVEFHPLFVPEFEALAEVVQDELLAHVTVLEAYGPHLGRPRVDTLHGSRVSNMKELRFDAARRAIVLCGGDKSGVSQKRFYRGLISRADARFASHVSNVRQVHRIRKRP